MPEPNDEHVRKATAHHRGGAGSHRDRRLRRLRTRRERDRWAQFDQEGDKGGQED